MLEFLVIFASGSGAVSWLLVKLVKGKAAVSVLRMDAVRSDAELEAAQEAARVAQGAAREQRVLIGDVLDRLKTVEHMDKTITGFVGFLMNEVAWRGGEPPTLPGAQGQPSITAGDPEERGRWS